MWSLSWSRSRRDSLSRPVCRPWRPENSSDSGKDGPQLSGKLPGKVNERVVRPSLRLRDCLFLRRASPCYMLMLMHASRSVSHPQLLGASQVSVSAYLPRRKQSRQEEEALEVGSRGRLAFVLSSRPSLIEATLKRNPLQRLSTRIYVPGLGFNGEQMTITRTRKFCVAV